MHKVVWTYNYGDPTLNIIGPGLSKMLAFSRSLQLNTYKG